MKIMRIAVVAVLGAGSLSALAKDADRVGAIDSSFTYETANGERSVVVGSTIEGEFSSQIAVAVASGHSAITGTGSRAITGTGGRAITGTGGR